MAGRIRSRSVETESVNQRMLRRGAVKRQHINRWAVGERELAPGIVGGTHLAPSSIERIREIVGEGDGLSIALTNAGQTIPNGGAALELTSAAAGLRPAGFEAVAFPTTSIVFPASRVASVLVRFQWDDWRHGGTVRLMRDGTVVDESPPSWGPRFSGVLHAGAVLEGESLSVEVDHGDAGDHDVSDVRVDIRVEGATGTSEAQPTGLYTVTWLQAANLFKITRYAADGSNTVLDSSAPASTGTNFVGIRARMDGDRIRARMWLWTDPEPSSWDLDIVDTAPLSAGLVGVTSTLTGSMGDPGMYRSYDTIEVGFDGEPTYSTDFSEYADGGLPADWQPLAGNGVANWEIISDGAFTGGKFLGYPTDSVGLGSFVGWIGGGSRADTDVVIRARPDEDNTTVGLILRGNPIDA